MQPLEQSQASENGMEALELDTPSDTVSIPESFGRHDDKFTRLGVMWVNLYC